MNLFLASEISKRNLTEDQAEAILDVLYPKDYTNSRSVTKSTLAQQLAYERWNKQHEYEEANKPKEPKKPELMSEQELDYLAEMGAF